MLCGSGKPWGAGPLQDTKDRPDTSLAPRREGRHRSHAGPQPAVADLTASPGASLAASLWPGDLDGTC